jgi:peptidoglycan/LPS O-acetylase OafA/YrhL
MCNVMHTATRVSQSASLEHYSGTSLCDATAVEDRMAPDGTFRLGYRTSLDGLRGVAVLMVMAHHAPFSFAQGGFLGVDVFFVLSGFLITGLLMQEHYRTGAISLRKFYARRALRLLPALVVMLSVVLALPGLFLPRGASPWRLALVVFFYAANWVAAYQLVDLDVLTPTWSLAIEEQFYLLWPPLLHLLLVLKIGRRWIVSFLLLGIASASIIRVTLWNSFGLEATWRLYYGLDTRMDSLLLGCLVGLLAAWDLLPKRGWLLAATRYAALAAAGILGVLTYTASRSGLEALEALFLGVELLASVVVAVLIVGLVTSPPRLLSLILEQPALVWAGRISYGLYLWHVPIFHGVLRGSHMTRIGIRLPLRPLRFVVAFGVASASFYLVEQPMLRLKERFRSGPRADVALTGSAPSSGA